MSNPAATGNQDLKLMALCLNVVMGLNRRKLCRCVDIGAFVASLPSMPEEVKTELKSAMQKEQTECDLDCPHCAMCLKFKYNLSCNLYSNLCSGNLMCSSCIVTLIFPQVLLIMVGFTIIGLIIAYKDYYFVVRWKE